MSRHHTSHRIDGPFIESDPIAELIRFYRANGYSVEQEKEGARPAGLEMRASSDEEAPEDEESEVEDAEDAEDADDLEDADVIVSATLVRGKEGASIWTSNMAELHAILQLELIGNTIKVDYDIETTMQHFTDDDRAFWSKEARKAESFVTGKVDAIIDWRENESIRIERQQKDIVVFGLQMMIVAAILMAILYFAFV